MSIRETPDSSSKEFYTELFKEVLLMVNKVDNLFKGIEDNKLLVSYSIFQELSREILQELERVSLTIDALNKEWSLNLTIDSSFSEIFRLGSEDVKKIADIFLTTSSNLMQLMDRGSDLDIALSMIGIKKFSRSIIRHDLGNHALASTIKIDPLMSLVKNGLGPTIFKDTTPDQDLSLRLYLDNWRIILGYLSAVLIARLDIESFDSEHLKQMLPSTFIGAINGEFSPPSLEYITGVATCALNSIGHLSQYHEELGKDPLVQIEVTTKEISNLISEIRAKNAIIARDTSIEVGTLPNQLITKISNPITIVGEEDLRKAFLSYMKDPGSDNSTNGGLRLTIFEATSNQISSPERKIQMVGFVQVSGEALVYISCDTKK